MTLTRKHSNLKKLKAIQLIAKNNGGVCISYVYNCNYMVFKCGRGHIWRMRPSHILEGFWCKACRIEDCQKASLERIKQAALAKNGKCTSNYFNKWYERLEFECLFGHIWKAKPADVLCGHWCPECAGQKKLGITYVKNLAKKNEIICLSRKYKNNKTKLKFKCKNGHVFYTTVDTVRHRTNWCPKCQVSTGEEVTRCVFEAIFNYKFPKKRPKWLKNPKTNRTMELDGYCKNLEIAFEYQGRQHYEKVWYMSNRSFENLQKRDVIKLDICHKHNVLCIPIKEFQGLLKNGTEEELITHIINQIKDYTSIPNNIDISSIVLTKIGISKLNFIKNIAKEKGGKCLSKVYINYRTKLKFICHKGHIWYTAPNTIKRGAWCPYCAGVGRYSLYKFKYLAELNGGKCLSNRYINLKTKLTFSCKLGHIFDLDLDYLLYRRKTWCPICKDKLVKE